MITLAFDTCLDKMYAILRCNGEVLESRTVENHDNKYHSAYLISTLKEILKNNNVSVNDINLIGVNIGPGSFTGIRACVTVARVMAQQLNCKAVGVSSLEILSKCAGEHPLIALDARKNSAYLFVDNEIKGAVPLEEVKTLIDTGKYFVLTDDKLQPILGGQSYQQSDLPLGEILAELSEEKSLYSECNWHLLKPLYIQPPPMG